MKVHGKVIIVTGGADGMGRELTMHLLRNGAKVVIADISEAAIYATIHAADRFKDNLLAVKTDICSDEDLDALIVKTINRFDRIDGLINNAGMIQPFCHIDAVKDATIQKVMTLNFVAAVNVTRKVLPYITMQREGVIVNVSSMGGFMPIAGQAIYGASKAALKMFSESLALELRDTGVNILTVYPGAMNTNIKHNSGLQDDNAKAEAGKALSPKIAAADIVNAIVANKSEAYIGKDSKLMHLLHRFCPKYAANMLYKQMNNHKQ
jgi:short-subunit dehydrogenase